jgi:NAD(P)-dependent dehydrogenase (short-subunit alcohol dehydrogenase family)
MLKDRIALVTGAGSGIGRAVALAFARRGAVVVLVGRKVAALEETYDQVLAVGGTATLVVLDLERQLERVSELTQLLAKRYGQLDILVNNAGQLGAMTPLAHYDPRIWETVFRVNVTAPFFLIRELLPLLRQSVAGSVINVTSGVAYQGCAYWGAYAASKAALANLTETWAAELVRTSVRINAVNPGEVATALRASAFPGEDSGKLLTPENITPVFLYLGSDASRGVTGVHLQARDWLHWQPGDPHPQHI